MVEQNSSEKFASDPQLKIAPVMDRLLALVLDVVILTPVFSFILAGVFRNVEWVYFTSPESTEFLVLCASVFFFVVILTVVAQSFFLLWLQATPGKYFFKMKVVSVSEPDSRLSLSQAFLRSFAWTLEFLFLGFPFLEVLSEKQRRPLHDRAAGTMVVTLKQQADAGPHSNESHLVRQMLVAAGLFAFTMVSLKVVHFYSMASRGEFKQTDLEAGDFLCSAVTHSVEKSSKRVDQALALYLADEISDECLQSEIDFVLWKADDSEKSWAYLAKGILKKSEPDQFEAYLQKACDASENDPACEIAQYEADPHGHSLPENTQTTLVLQASQKFEAAHYDEAQKIFISLAQKNGFEDYSKQGLVKVFWAQNKIEKSRGAYENVVHQIPMSQRRELSAWICHEELDQSCSAKAISACEDLKSEVAESKGQIHEPFVALALIREQACLGSNPQLSEELNFKVKDLLESKKDFAQFVSAVLNLSSGKDEKSLNQLEDLAFRKQAVHPQFVRRMALQEWSSRIKTDKQFETAGRYLEGKKVRDLSWIKFYKNTIQSMIQSGSTKQSSELANLPTASEVATYQLEGLQVQAFYQAHDFQKAWKVLAPTLDSLGGERSPASVTSSKNPKNLSYSKVRSELIQKFSKEPR